MRKVIAKVSKLVTEKSSYSKDKSNKHGEVFTPNELIYEMISKLPRDIWEDPSKTFLDPCSGKGNFPIYIVKKLFVHLQEHIVDEEERLKHIVEKQLFMAEFQRESAEFIATAFTFGKGYKVNLYVGDTLQMPEDFFDLSWEERREKYPDKVV
jgi:type I restriction-modification system DNA methylase subunit